MDELERIRVYLKQNQKIIRFASESLTLDGNFEDSVIKKYNEDAETVQDYSLDIDGFRSSFADFKDSSNQSLITINESISLSVKKTNVVSQLNSELKIDGNVIDCTTKKFLVNTSNFILTEDSLTFNGVIHGATCEIGKFGIEGDTMTGGTDSTISSGSIYCNTLYLKNAVANIIDCNPEGLEKRAVTFTSSKNLDTDEKEETSTSVQGELVVKGDIWATNGWDDTEHGTPYSFWYNYILAKNIYLMSSSGSYSTKNRLRCSEVYSSKEDDTWSDARKKRNIHALKGEEVKKFFTELNPKSFTLKKTKKRGRGYIAQELGKCMLEHGYDGIVEKHGDYYGVRYPELTAFRIKMIQENQKKIEELTKRALH